MEQLLPLQHEFYTFNMKNLLTYLIILISLNNYYGQTAPYASFNSSTNSYIDIGSGNSLNCYDTLSQGDQFSITLWVRWSNFNDPGVGPWANLFTMSDSTNSGDNGVWWLQHNGSNTRFEFALHTTSRSYIVSNTTPLAGNWYHVSCVYNGSQMQIYVNGALENTAAKTGNIRPFPAASKLNFGRWPNPGNNYRRFNGEMDEISIWNIALSSNQINNLILNPESVTGANHDTTGILGYWNFDTNNANDLSPCANNGIVGSDVALPITLLNFNGILKDNNVALTWTTVTEINNDYFTLERSHNAYNWTAINKVNGAGNSTIPTSYAVSDDVSELKRFSSLVYYRLKQTDFNGKYSYSDVLAISILKDITITIANKFLIITGMSTAQQMTIRIATIDGKQLFNETISDDTKINLTQLSKGTYFYQIIYSDKLFSKKFVIL